MSFVWLSASIMLAAASNLIMKSRSVFNAGNDSGLNYVTRMALDPLVWLGAIAFFAGTLAWILAIRKLELSIAQPIMASMFVIVPIGSFVFLNEPLPPLRMVGLALIAVGVVVVARTA
jgi:drug/metabolite transporter (DMT)-like permease